MLNKIMVQNKNIDMESVGVLDNDKDFAIIQSEVDKLHSLYVRSLLPNDLNIRTNKECNGILSTIEKALTKRIGMTFKFYGTNYGAHCIVTPPPENNIVVPESRHLFTWLTRVFEKYEVNAVNKVDDITTQSDSEAINSTLYKSMLSLEETLIGKNMKVDFKNMSMKGMNKDVVTLVGIPFKVYFQNKLTSREIVAIIAHEVGHAFNMISNMHQMATSVMTTADALVSNTPNEKEIVSMAENVYNQKFKSANELFYKLFSDNVNFDNNDYIWKNNESGADQLATRLGYGEELTTSLVKLHGLNIDYEEEKESLLSSYFTLVRTALFLIFASMVVLVLSILFLELLILVSPLIIILAIAKFIAMLISKLVDIQVFSSPKLRAGDGEFVPSHDYDRSYNTDSPYDDLKQRFRRIKMDIIRQIRVYNLSKKTEEKYLLQISNIDTIMINIEQNRGGFKLIKHILFMEREEVGTAKFFMNVEEIMENDFHVRDKEFKKLLKR